MVAAVQAMKDSAAAAACKELFESDYSSSNEFGRESPRKKEGRI